MGIVPPIFVEYPKINMVVYILREREVYPKVPLQNLKKEVSFIHIWCNSAPIPAKLPTSPRHIHKWLNIQIKTIHHAGYGIFSLHQEIQINVCMPKWQNILQAELMAIQHTPSFLHPTLPTYIFIDNLVSIYLLCNLRNSPSPPHIVINLQQSTPLLLNKLTWSTYTKAGPT